MKRVQVFGALAALTVMGGCAGMSDGAAATPQPAKPVDSARLYSGRWYEIARTPTKLTDGCVAGTTDFQTDADGKVIEHDACRDKSPEGKEKTISGPVTILNPGENTKLRVRYQLFGVLPLARTYWVLDHGDDDRWFIFSDPAFKNLNLFTRSPRPSPEEVKQLTARARSLGYDTSKLEYPTPFPPGEGEAPAR
jgi:apolipoprotein D and lipocalin family protein